MKNGNRINKSGYKNQPLGAQKDVAFFAHYRFSLGSGKTFLFAQKERFSHLVNS